MSKMQWFVIIAALILVAGVGGWVTSTKGSRSVHFVAPATTTQSDALRAMSKAKDLPSPQYDLY
jgi:hypothetical protein